MRIVLNKRGGFGMGAIRPKPVLLPFLLASLVFIGMGMSSGMGFILPHPGSPAPPSYKFSLQIL